MAPLSLRPAVLALFAATLFLPEGSSESRAAQPAFDPLLSDPGAVCASPFTGAWQRTLVQIAAAKSENAPFQTGQMQPAGGEVPLYKDLGTLSFKVSTVEPRAQAYFDQGLRLAFAFNHAEAIRAFRAAQQIDPHCAMCYWGEALALGPNINAPMPPEANPPALEATGHAQALASRADARERVLIEALARRYSADPKADRSALDAAYADAMHEAARRYPRDDTIQVLFAEAAMDTQPWDYWEAGGTRPKGRAADLIAALETVLKRNPGHPGAIHLYIHAVEASTTPERALAPARRLAALMPGAGHIVHMPAHIYYRTGLFRDSLEANKKAIAVDERYFQTSPSDPLYRTGYYPHNIHFVLVSAQMGGDATTALEAAAKLDGVMPADVVRQFPSLEAIKGAPYTTHALFSEPATILALPRPAEGLTLVTAMYHYARAVAFAANKDLPAARAELDALTRIEANADFQPYAAWQVPAREIVQTARLVAGGRVADAEGDLDAAAKDYEAAVAIEDALSYMEPPYWYYPVRQSLGAVKLRQGRLDEAEKAFRDSLGKVRNNGWALAGLAEVYRQQRKPAAQAEAQKAFSRAWFGPAGGPALERL
ncbi:hypothetical protein dqs_2759 [Azoarcus olearius]|uniref:hypothetical protein n=1 Tax=Azoarcus sp. (strain BH72) TaxID=418699 RepID=UPI0008060D69|nr:hypothetical protein [Azoarcus olearius]ANQ85788.1 hypothetical protein dqs_2759 [Azoarcus olearius]